MASDNNRNRTVYLDVYVVRELDASLLVEETGTQETALIPLSQLRDGSVSNEGETGCIAIPRWLAADRGLPYREEA